MKPYLLLAERLGYEVHVVEPWEICTKHLGPDPRAWKIDDGAICKDDEAFKPRHSDLIKISTVWSSRCAVWRGLSCVNDFFGDQTKLGQCEQIP